jgi:oxaloacetate decarboxylase gamma subunit
MEGILSNAFSILVVGMITVLLILWLVVVVGNVLIGITNKFWPLPDGKETKDGNTAIPANKMAAIVAAVQMYTGGKGKITTIEKK